MSKIRMLPMDPTQQEKTNKELHVVVMIEPRCSFEPEMKVSEQINEVFGPFSTGDEADRFVEQAQKYINEPREWLIIPLSKVEDLLSPERN